LDLHHSFHQGLRLLGIDGWLSSWRLLLEVAILCADNQAGVDMILPMVYKDKTFGEDEHDRHHDTVKE